jgi:hypothetical protein
MAFDDHKTVRPVIDDPLARFYDTGPAPQAGVKNPVTGLREQTDVAHKQELRAAETKRKGDVNKRIISQLMQNDLGREFIYDLLATCNVFGTPFNADPQLTAYNSGALFIGRLIEDWIKKYSMQEYGVMLMEGLEREKTWADLAADK